MARPSRFSEALFNSICDRIADGESLRAVCRGDAMPSAPTVLRWVADDPKLEAAYRLAVDARADVIFDEILNIADDTSKDWIEKGDATVLDSEHVRRSVLRVDSRKWVLSRMAPKRYGDKLQLGGDADGAPLTVVIRRFSDA